MNRNWIAAIVVFVVFAGLGGIFWWQMLTPATAAPIVRELSPATVICGKFAAPPLLVGVPATVPTGGTAIAFADGYLLQLKAIPSMFIGKRALFQIEGGIVVNYGLVGETYNPCPVK